MDRMRAQMRGDRPRRPEGVRFDPARPAAHGDAPSPPRFPHISSGHPDETDADAAAAAAAAASAAAASDAASDADANAFAASTDADAHRAALAALESDRATLRDEILRVARVDAERAAELDAERARRADLEDELEELRAFVRAGGGRVPARAADASRPSSASASAGDEELARLRDQLRESLDARSEDARAAAAAAARAAALIDDLEALNVRFAEDAIAADEAETRARDEIRSARDARLRRGIASRRRESRLDAALEAAKATATIRIPTGPSRVVSPSSSDEAAAAAERAARAWREDVRRETTRTRSALADMDAMDRAFRDARERSEATAREHAAAIDDASRRAAEATEDARREFRRLAREATNVGVAAGEVATEVAATAKAAKAKAEAERASAVAAAAVEESTARRRAAEAAAASALAEASSAAEARSEAERAAAAAERRLAEERADAESRRRRHEDERVALERRAAALARERDEAEARHREERRAWSEETRKLRAAVLAGGYGDAGVAAGTASTVSTVSTVPTAVLAGTGARSRAPSPGGPGVVLGADASASRLAPSSPERVPEFAHVRPRDSSHRTGYDGYIGSLPPSPAPPPPPPAPPPPGADSTGIAGRPTPWRGGRDRTKPRRRGIRIRARSLPRDGARARPGEPPPTGRGSREHRRCTRTARGCPP